jgi:glutamate synthase (NADPH) small chain
VHSSRPPDIRSTSNPWPQWPRIYGVDYGHAEVQNNIIFVTHINLLLSERLRITTHLINLLNQVMSVFGNDPRQFSVTTTEFKGEQGNLKSLVTQNVEVVNGSIKKIPGTEREWPADLVILSMGFVSPEGVLAEKLGLDLDQRNNIHAEYGDYTTSVDGIFAAGDCRRGQSLVVWAINEGRGVAEKCHRFLMNRAVQDE